MPKEPKTVGELISVLSKYDKDYPVQIELVKNHGEVSLYSLYGEIDDVYRGEDITTDDETVFIRFEN